MRRVSDVSASMKRGKGGVSDAGQPGASRCKKVRCTRACE